MMTGADPCGAFLVVVGGSVIMFLNGGVARSYTLTVQEFDDHFNSSPQLLLLLFGVYGFVDRFTGI